MFSCFVTTLVITGILSTISAIANEDTVLDFLKSWIACCLIATAISALLIKLMGGIL